MVLSLLFTFTQLWWILLTKPQMWKECIKKHQANSEVKNQRCEHKNVIEHFFVINTAVFQDILCTVNKHIHYLYYMSSSTGQYIFLQSFLLSLYVAQCCLHTPNIITINTNETIFNLWEVCIYKHNFNLLYFFVHLHFVLAAIFL